MNILNNALAMIPTKRRKLPGVELNLTVQAIKKLIAKCPGAMGLRI
jgi:hypothetical protein